MPPLIIKESEMEDMFSRLDRALNRAQNELGL